MRARILQIQFRLLVFGFPFPPPPPPPPPTAAPPPFLPLSDTNQNSAAFCNSAVMSLLELIRKWVDCWDFKGNVFKRWKKKKSIILIKCISIEKQILQGRPSIRFHILLCCLIVINKRRFGRVELRHFVKKNVVSK